jgi:hypothetical protein
LDKREISTPFFIIRVHPANSCLSSLFLEEISIPTDCTMIPPCVTTGGMTGLASYS